MIQRFLVTLALSAMLDASLFAGDRGLAAPRLYSAYAPPAGVWGPQLEVEGQLGKVSLTISAQPVGSTVIIGEVEYWADKKDKKPQKKQFKDSITITTADGVLAPIKLRFKSQGSGSAVNVTVK